MDKQGTQTPGFLPSEVCGYLGFEGLNHVRINNYSCKWQHSSRAAEHSLAWAVHQLRQCGGEHLLAMEGAAEGSPNPR